MQSKAITAQQYLDELPEDRRKVLALVRKTIRKNLPKGFKETMQYGMISYIVPLSLFPEGYLGKRDVPLPYACIASQKNHMAVYLMNVYTDQKTIAWFTKEYTKTGQKLDMGKSCIRFKKLENLNLDAIGKAIARTSIDEYILLYQKSRKKK